MALKLLLVALATTRMVEVAGKEEERRVRFAAKTVAELTDAELETLDKLTQSTGKLHYRDPITEGGQKAVASEPELVSVPDYAGQDVKIGSKNVEQLKAYLTFHGVAFKSSDTKDDLLELAKTHEATGLTGNADPDSGL